MLLVVISAASLLPVLGQEESFEAELEEDLEFFDRVNGETGEVISAWDDFDDNTGTESVNDENQEDTDLEMAENSNTIQESLELETANLDDEAENFDTETEDLDAEMECN